MQCREGPWDVPAYGSRVTGFSMSALQGERSGSGSAGRAPRRSRRLLPLRAGGPPTSRAGRAWKGPAMAKTLYVGYLVWAPTPDDLYALFQEHGTVAEAQVITDRETGRSRGFGFVRMNDDQEAQKAIEALNGSLFKGRPLTVNEARPRESRGGGGGGPP